MVVPSDKNRLRFPPKSAIRRFWLVILLIGIIFISFFTSTPISDFKFGIVEFSTNNDISKSRADYPITFRWKILGHPSQVGINWGDGRVEDVMDRLYEEDGMYLGEINHSYSLQGVFSPKLQCWDFKGKEYSRSLPLRIQNEEEHFQIALPPNHQINEDQDVFIDIGSLFKFDKRLNPQIENFTYLFDFSDAQVSTKEPFVTYAWEDGGKYPLTVSVIDSQGTISRDSMDIQVNNKPPKARISVMNNDLYSNHSRIEFNAEESRDTKNDMKSLRYLWDWGDDSAGWGKYASHFYGKGKHPH